MLHFINFNEWNFVVCLIIFFLPVLLFLIRRSSSNSGHRPLPPGPKGWPVIGNMFNLGTMPHRNLIDLGHKFGPMIWLTLGVRNTSSVQSAKAAAEFFKNHDLSFVERTVNENARVHDYHKGSLVMAPYGTHWPVMRRLVTVEMVVNKRINETTFIRKKCIDNMQLWIEEEPSKVKEGCGVHVAFVFLMTFNLLGNLMLSRDLVDPNLEEGMEFFKAVNGLMEWNGSGNMVDFFPWLRWLDPQGLKRKMKRDLGKDIQIASKFVKERIQEREVGGEKTKDFLDVLLEYEGNGIGNMESSPRPYKYIANLVPPQCRTTLNTPPHVWQIFKPTRGQQLGDVERMWPFGFTRGQPALIPR